VYVLFLKLGKRLNDVVDFVFDGDEHRSVADGAVWSKCDYSQVSSAPLFDGIDNSQKQLGNLSTARPR
jgi:hypothetical protein